MLDMRSDLNKMQFRQIGSGPKGRRFKSCHLDHKACEVYMNLTGLSLPLAAGEYAGRCAYAIRNADAH